MYSPTPQVNPQLNKLLGVINRVGELRLLWGVNADKATNTFTSETARPDARGRSTNGTSTSDGTSALSGDLEPVVESDNASITSIRMEAQNVNLNPLIFERVIKQDGGRKCPPLMYVLLAKTSDR